jgi:hypothetical protein
MAPYAKGDRVLHAQYGPGTLTDINEFHTVIDFDQHGVHKFATSMVVLQSTDEPAPARSGARRRKSAATPRSPK